MDSLTVSYLTLRKLIGILGMFLAFICVIGGLIVTGTIEKSISAYYYTVMRDVMVGVLITSGAFLLTYKGYDFKDNLVSSIAGVSGIRVALFPAEYRIIHLIFAMIFFLSLAYMSYFQFTLGNNKRNRIYKICGIVIVVSLILFPISKSIPYSILILETIMLLSFGFSWYTKGRTL